MKSPCKGLKKSYKTAVHLGENAEKIAANKAQKKSPLTRLRKIAANKAQKEISIAVHLGAEQMNHNA